MNNELNGIQLNGSMLASMYGNSLVDATSKKALVAVKTTLTDQQLSFLWQILNACKLDAENVTLINTGDKKTSLEIILAELKPQYILSFGAGSGTELFSMANSRGTHYLNAPALDEMMLDTDKSKQLKRKTWNELKAMFSI